MGTKKHLFFGVLFLAVIIQLGMITPDNDIISKDPFVEKEVVVENGNAEHNIVKKLSGTINSKALSFALLGMQNFKNIKQDRLIIIDFSLPSTEKRFFVINPKTGELVFKTYVAHGQGSGTLYATAFSNKNGSHMSSLGFFKTAETYSGKHGHSLRLDGLQPGLNSAARERAVVIHQADYVSKAFIDQNGYLGRSWGCPALPSADYNRIIKEISNGTLLLIYHPDLENATAVL